MSMVILMVTFVGYDSLAQQFFMDAMALAFILDVLSRLRSKSRGHVSIPETVIRFNFKL